MPDDTQTPSTTEAEEVTGASDPGTADQPAKKVAKKAAKKAAPRKTAARKTAKKAAGRTEPADPADPASDVSTTVEVAEPDVAPAATAPAKKAARSTAKKTAAKRTSKKAAAAADLPSPVDVDAVVPDVVETPAPPTVQTTTRSRRTAKKAAAPPVSADDAPAPGVLFQAPQPTVAAAVPVSAESAEDAEDAAEAAAGEATPDATPDAEAAGDAGDAGDNRAESDDEQGEGTGRRRRRRGGRRRRKSGDNGSGDGNDAEGDADATDGDAKDETRDSGKDSGKESGKESGKDDVKDGDDQSGEGGSRRRRRRRRSGDGSDGDGADDPTHTVTRVRKGRSAEDQITAVSGSTRLEAKKQRRREGREAGRRRAPIVSEAEFLARRESVERVMVVRQRDELTQIGVLEDKVLVEHYVSRESQTSLIGNIYLGKVQNVLPSMEAAFIDIGRGRNAVLYAGEVNWSSLGHKDGQARRIESVLSSGQTVLVQVTKDPVGQKGARLTSQISLAGRFLVYVPDGTTSGISRKLPDTERNRLKTLLKELVPDTAGVIVRTAAEGASEEELTQDVERLTARFADIEKKTKGSAPQLLYGEPDLTVKVVRDLFTEDFGTLVVQGDDAWDTIEGYVAHVAPDLQERLERYAPADHNGADLFAAYRVDEQIAKALDRKVWLPSGGSLVIDRTEAMTVVDVNTGKFTGSGGNLEETVTKNNLEAAEEVVRQLRLRDIGGIIVVDFIDMVLESNRDLVLRRLVECLGRDRTRHQVAEVTSLGLVQMTRKRIGTGLLEAFSESCEHCSGRGLVVHDHPVETSRSDDDNRRGGASSSGGRRSRGGRGRGSDDARGDVDSAPRDENGNGSRTPSPRVFAAMARHHESEVADASHEPAETPDESATGTPELAPVAAPEAAPEMVVAEVVDEVRTDAEVTVGVDLETAAVADAVTEAVAEAARPVGAGEAAAAPVAPPEAATSTPVESAGEPEPPRVITRTRRRSASRPAGPPPSAEPGGAGPVGSASAEEAGAAVDDTAPEPHDGAELDPVGTVGHVPVKRRGFRRR